MQLEQRQPRRIAELATAAVAELPSRHREEHCFIFVGDFVAYGGLRVALRSDDEIRLGFGDVFAPEGEWAFWGFQHRAGFGSGGTEGEAAGVREARLVG